MIDELLAQLVDAQAAYHAADADFSALMERHAAEYRAGLLGVLPVERLRPILTSLRAGEANLLEAETRLAVIGRAVLARGLA